MKTNLLILFSLLFVLFSFSSHADENLKHFNIGIGGYAMNITDDDNDNIDIDFSGTTISAQYAFNDQMALRAEFYSLENDNISAIEINGYTLSGYLGVGLATQGFKIYVGGGIFSETLESPLANDQDFSGLQGNAGIGYNWEYAALDAGIGIRDPSDYEDEIADEPIVVTASVTFSIRI